MADLIERADAINAIRYVTDSLNYSKTLGELLHLPSVEQTETHDLHTETHECVKQTDCEGCEHWKYIAHEWQCETVKCQKNPQTDCGWK